MNRNSEAMKQLTERNAVKFVAKLSPWLAPMPSAYFVARSSITHLALPWPVAVIVAAIIETLGLATVHTALWLSDWNHTKRKVDPSAPTVIALALGAVYLVTTLGLIVALEVWPDLATYAPALFPLLAIVGTVNLALIANQERREAEVVTEKAERKTARKESRLRAETQRLDADLAQMRQLAAQDAQMRQLAAQSAESTAQNMYTCAQCGASFGKQQGLAAHIRHAHRNGHGWAAQSEPVPQAPQGEAGQAQEAAR